MLRALAEKSIFQKHRPVHKIRRLHGKIILPHKGWNECPKFWKFDSFPAIKCRKVRPSERRWNNAVMPAGHCNWVRSDIFVGTWGIQCSLQPTTTTCFSWTRKFNSCRKTRVQKEGGDECDHERNTQCDDLHYHALNPKHVTISLCLGRFVFVFPTIFHKGRKIKPATLSWAGIVFRLRSGELLVSSVFSKTCTNKQAFIARTDFSWWWHYINWSLYVRAFFIVTNPLVLQLSLQPRTQRAGKCTTKGNAVCIDPGLYILHHS